MKKNFQPTTQEIRQWILATLKHCCQVEYYFDILKLGKNDPQRPHDITGQGNKFTWAVIKGLAIGDRNNDPKFFKKYVLPSINLHRQGQYHHKKWNKPISSVDKEDMKEGGVDAICSLLENRKYQGHKHTLTEIEEIIKNNSHTHAIWMNKVFKKMKKIKPPNLEIIKSIKNIPNLGLPEDIYQKINRRTQETIKMLQEKYGYKDL